MAEENFVHKTLDKLLDVIEVELKLPLGIAEVKMSPTAIAKEWRENQKKRIELENAIQRAEEKYVADHKDQKVAQMLREFPLYADPEFREIVAGLLTHLNETKITWLAEIKLTKTWGNIVSTEEIRKKLELYLPYLRDELNQIKEFRDVISTLRFERIEEKAQETVEATRRIEEHVIEIRKLLGKSASLIELDTIRPASQDRLESFYQGATSLSWDIIAIDGDVKRDLYDDLLNKYETKPLETIEMICITGEEAAGKSTFAWRVAAELSKSLNLPLIQAKIEDFWDSLDGLIDQYAKPIIVLVDDIFRSASAKNFLKLIKPETEIILIATSRLNEIPDDLPLPFNIEYIRLQKPTAEEKDKAITKIKATKTLDSTQRDDINKANTWLELMCAITTGDDLSKHVRDNVRRLRDIDGIVYRAYEYLCYAGQYDLDVPIELLDRLDNQGNFHEIHKRPSAKGLIFPSNQQKIYLGVHSTHAKFALEVFSRDPIIVADELIKSVDSSNPKQRVFIANLLLSISSDQRKKIKDIAISKLKSAEVKKMLLESSMGELLNYWIRTYANVDREKLHELKEMALEKPFSSSEDWGAANRAFSDDAQFVGRFLDKTIEWLRNDHVSPKVRKSLFYLVENKGTLQQLTAVFERTIEWLESHPADLKVRSSFLDFVYRNEKTSKEQREFVIEKTLRWLEGNQGNFAILISCFLLLKSVWNIKQVKKEIILLSRWLNERVNIINSGSIYVVYLDLIEKIANVDPSKELIKQIDDAIKQVGNWIKDHPEDLGTREYLVSFVTRRGSTEQSREIISETENWLDANPLDIEIRPLFINLVGRRGDNKDIEITINKTSQWLKENPGNKNVRVRWNYLNLVAQKGSADKIRGEIKKTKQWLNSPYYSFLTNFEKAFSFMRFGSLYNKLEEYNEAEKAFSQSIRLYSDLTPARIFRAWCYYHRNQKRIANTQLKDLLKLTRRNKKHPISDIYFELGKYYFLEQEYTNAEENFKKAIQFCDYPNFNPYIYYIELGRTQLVLKSDNAVNTLGIAKKLTLNLYIDKTVETKLDNLIEETK